MNKGYASGFISSDIKSEIMNTKNGDMKKIKFSIACNRKTKGEADFPWFVAFGKLAENIERYFSKGRGIYVEYKIQTGSYKNKEDKTVYTTDHVITDFEFPPIKKNEEQPQEQQTEQTSGDQPSAPDDFVNNIPDDLDMGELPFR